MADTTGAPTLRNLSEGFESTPLRHFVGRLAGYDRVEKKPTKLNFVDVTVIESVEPWPQATAELEIWESNRTKSGWGVFANSVLPYLQPHEDFPALIGRMLEMKYTPGHKLPVKDKATGKFNDEEKNAWEVMSVDGKANSATPDTTEDEALNLLDGKTIEVFTPLAINTPVLRSNQNLLPKLTSRTFASEMVSENRATVDAQGVYHKVK